MRDRIAQLLDRLSPAERKVGDWVLADPAAVTTGTLAGIARGAGVSEPTVIRFCRSLGLEGFAELRLALARAEGGAAPPPRRIGPATPVAEAAGAVCDSALATLAELRRGLDPAAIERAALAVVRAARIEVWGLGASAAAAEALAHGLFRIGRGVVARHDPHLQAMAAATLDGEAVALCLSRSGLTRELVEVAQLAAAAGATVVAITRPGTPLAAAATLLIPCAVAEEAGLHAPMATRLAQLVLGDALAVAAALLSPPAAAERLSRMQAALQARRLPP
ncbi:MurR/RpiR family transcriptional regulator [Falsiroseomonas tokyonensis]|uniref:MurR/RpiR family transcriptional regulator n=1 Tax=Falsiroseomonas tokyonensis TaxID=430521 RepID=A0ABV7BUR2_9PROT|nr:MurR/RpiR family transcriptional regulator [Falsiroseomonas tokyonensis]MBU8538161.1 MurR/RpiR family transcriptional regulator [Falsiroseomonas tokyonensis]